MAKQASDWPIETVESVELAFEIAAELQGKQWICRGQSDASWSLTPSIDRKANNKFTRIAMLQAERECINQFRLAARNLQPGEEGLFQDDIVALMVMRHYDVPTRLLDWSQSPFVALYFAVTTEPEKDASIWTFDYYKYRSRGEARWKEIPKDVFFGDPPEFDAKISSFRIDYEERWVICAFYSPGFPRQAAQSGLFIFSPLFGVAHDELLSELLEDTMYFCKYIIPSRLKQPILEQLSKLHGITPATLFPDSQGVANHVRKLLESRLKVNCSTSSQVSEKCL